MLALWIIVSVIIALTAYLLFIPITIRLNLLIDQKISVVSAVKIYPFEYKFISGKHKKSKKPKVSVPKKLEIELSEKPTEKQKSKLSLLGMSDLALIFGVIAETFKFAGRVIKTPNYFFNAEIAGGASEPDITGELYGAYHAIRPVLPDAISINYSPDFAAEKFTGTVEMGLVIRIIGLLRETLIFIFRLPIIRLFKLYRKLKKGA
jgi:hypothetical protein